jgi:hypothetical protein
VLNNPLSAVDPDGLDCVYDNGNGTYSWNAGDCHNSIDNGNGFYFDGFIDFSYGVSLKRNGSRVIRNRNARVATAIMTRRAKNLERFSQFMEYAGYFLAAYDSVNNLGGCETGKWLGKRGATSEFLLLEFRYCL